MIKAQDGGSIGNAIGLQSLLDEPTRLASEAERLNAELESLVMDNYKVFVENLTCSVHLKLEDKKLADISSELDQNLHDLAQQCLTFKDRVNHFVGSHKRNRKTLQHHMQLVELLEVPQLVDACARNGFHDEALELANFVNGLERRHLLASEVKSSNGKLRGGSGVIQTIVDDVHHTLSGLRHQLLVQLTENTALPKEISILATLRKLDGLLIDRHLSQGKYEADNMHGNGANKGASSHQAHREKMRQTLAQNSEVRLQMDFLEARTIWLHRSAERALHLQKPDAESKSSEDLASSPVKPRDSSSSSSVGNKASLGPYGKAIEMLEIRRTAWFAVITQFNALFQETHSTSNTVSKSASAEHFSLQTFSPAIVLSTWATHQVNQLLRELQVLLAAIEDGASLRSVLEQSLFFASRMGQVGCDFSGLVLPLFQEIMLERFSKEVTRAMENFKIMLLTEKISFDPKGDTVYKDQLIPLYAAQDPTSAEIHAANAASKDMSGSGELAAPQALMRFPPIAYLLNCLLTHMNYIRECPLVTTEVPALQLLVAMFQNICAFLVQKANEVRTLGEKYLDGARGGKKPTKIAADASKKVETMDVLYAQALAQELLPHLLLCFESIFNTNAVRKDARSKALKAKELRRSSSHAQNPTAPISLAHPSGTRLVCLVQSLYDAQDLFDNDGLGRLEAVWTVLEKGGLLGAEVLQRQAPVVHAPAPVAVSVVAAPVRASVSAESVQSDGAIDDASAAVPNDAPTGDDDLDS